MTETSQGSSNAGVPTCYRHPGVEAHIRCQRCERPICPECMVPAAVGFQCPECVRIGHSTTRQPRSSFGGLLTRGNHASTSIVLIAINVVVWLAINLTGGNGSKLVEYLALRPLSLCAAGRFGAWGITHDWCTANGGSFFPGVQGGAYWQLLTSAFTQVTILHIFFNVLNLYILGPQLEQVMGRARYLTVFLLSAIGGSVGFYLIGPETGSAIGASGAVFGLMGAFVVLAIRSRAQIQGMLVWIGINFAYGLFVSGIAWQAHLGGFITGAAATAVLAYAPRKNRSNIQWAGLAAVAVVLVVLTVVRTAALSTSV